MNLLPIALSLLMLMTIMTTFRLQQFLLTSGVMTEAACVMQQISRLYDNRLQIKRYESKHITKPTTPSKQGEDDENDEEDAGAVEALSTLHLAFFSDSSFAKTNAQYVPLYTEFLHRTTQLVYARHEFFQKASEENPNLIPAIWNEVSKYLKEKEEEKKPIKQVNKLVGVKFSDPELEKVWMEMLKDDRVDPQSLAESCKNKKKAPKYFPTILKFLQARGEASLALRIQLLPRELLVAIFQDESTVENIMSERYTLYKQVSNADEKERPAIKKRASEEFENHFKGALPAGFPPDKANFQITGTRPPR